MQAADLVIRPERPDDESAVRAVNEAAFGRSTEADLVDRLRLDGAVIVSLVAEQDGLLVGHVLFSRISIESAAGPLPSAALAPLAVLPANQRRGIGGRLVDFGLGSLRRQGERSVLVLGHPHYYQRFGFSIDSARMLIVPFPAEAFMALEMVPDALRGIRGAVRYPAAFGL
jgi:putative acetyltransferase